jgi:hypothetical protein
MSTAEIVNPLFRALRRTIGSNRSLGSNRRSRAVFRRRSSNAGTWAAVTVVIGAAAAFLYGSSTGRGLLSRIGKSTGGGAGKLLGGVVGAHPVQTSKLVEAGREFLSSRESRGV